MSATSISVPVGSPAPSCASPFPVDSNGIAGATGRALGVIDTKLRLQAYSLSFIDVFHLFAWACVVMLLVTAVIRRSPLSFAQLPGLQQGSISPQESRS